jgi:hypothetical protein
MRRCHGARVLRRIRIRFHIHPALMVAGVAEENQIMTAVTACASWVPAREDIDHAYDDSVVIDLVARARGGDKQAWDALVERYAPLIWSICRRYRLGRADADDVAQSVWLRLVDQLDKIREPAALPGWLAATARRSAAIWSARHPARTRPATRSTPRPSRTSRPGRPSKNCSRPSATRHCAKRLQTCPRTASS